MGSTVSPPYGSSRVVPDGVLAAWGARVIVNQGGGVDFVPDRMGAEGPDGLRAQLIEQLNEKVPLREVGAVLRDLLVGGFMLTREGEDFILYMDDELVLHASTNASAGYCYLTAWLVPYRQPTRFTSCQICTRGAQCRQHPVTGQMLCLGCEREVNAGG